MASKNSKLVALPEAAIQKYLNGRPRDPRVKYATYIPRGKMYRTEKQKLAVLETAKPKVEVIDQGDGNMKPALPE